MNEKIEDQNKNINPEKEKIGPEVLDNARQFNFTLATRGPAALSAIYPMAITSENRNLVTGVTGMVIGSVGFFANRYYHQKGDDSPHTHLGRIVGAAQFSVGFCLLAAEGCKQYFSSGEASPLLNTLQMATVALGITQGALILINSYLYGEGTPKPGPTPNKTKPL